MFHLVLPNHDQVAHVVSDDGLAWKLTKTAIRSGDPGECDDDMIWTMHVVPHPAQPGRFHMYYTGCSFAERGCVQRVALATSDDLYNWTKHNANPIVESKAPHYNENFNLVGIISFRDPFVFIEDGVWHMFVTARENEGLRFRRGCVAHAVSANGIDWELKPAIYAPRLHEDLEVPAVIRMNGRYYLFYGDFVSSMHYCVADKLDGPYLAPAQDLLLPEKNLVFRFCQWQGKTLVYHWLRADCDWRRRGAGGGHVMVPPPKEVEVGPTGEIVLRSFSGWSKYHSGTPAALPATTVAQRASGQALTVHPGEHDNFILETEITLHDGRAIGLLFRSDKDVETCNWLRFNYVNQTVELIKNAPYDSAQHRYKLRKTKVQSASVRLEYGRPVRVRLLACQEHIEVSIDNEVKLCAATYAAKRGRFGAFVEDGSGSVGAASVQKLTPPPRMDPFCVE